MIQPPTHEGLPFLGNLHKLYFNPLDFFMKMQKRYGDVVKINLGYLGKVYFAFNPTDIKTIFQNGLRLHRSLLRELVGNGLFVVQSGEARNQQRKMLQPAFNHDRIQTMLGSIVNTVGQTFNVILDKYAKHNQPFNILEEMKNLTIKIISRLVFSDVSSYDEKILIQSISFVITYLDKQLFTMFKFPRNWPVYGNKLFRESMAQIHYIINKNIDARKNGVIAEDLFTMIMTATNQATEEKITLEQIHHEIISIFVAGTETSSAALTWLCYLLSQHRDVQDKLRSVIHNSVQQRQLVYDDLKNLDYAKRLVQETLRLYPPAWAMIRVLPTSTTLASTYELAENSRVWVSPFVTHRHPSCWNNPDDFNPDRFLPENSAKRPLFSYFPFGGGAHHCIGNELAVVEAQII